LRENKINPERSRQEQRRDHDPEYQRAGSRERNTDTRARDTGPDYLRIGQCRVRRDPGMTTGRVRLSGLSVS